MMGEEKRVGESDDDFPWCGDFNRRRWRRDGSSYPLVVFSFFSFVIMRSSFFRNKKPHAALAMERTNPINQKQITNESYGTNKYPPLRRFLLRRAIGHI